MTRNSDIAEKVSRGGWWKLLAVALAVVVLVIGVLLLQSANDRTVSEKNDAEATATTAAAQASEGQSLAVDLVEACKAGPVLTPEGKDLCPQAAAVASATVPSVGKPDDGKDGDTGPGIRSTVCQADGTWLIAYTDGRTQVVAGPCKAQDGAPGTAGAPYTGPAPTNGKDGEDGSKGDPGRGVTSFVCLADGNWQVTYTDGVTELVAGPCVGQPGPSGTNGSVVPGTYSCPDGQYLAGFVVNADGSMSITCVALPTQGAQEPPPTEAPTS